MESKQIPVFQLHIPAYKNVSFMLLCLYFQALVPDDLGGCGFFFHPSSWVKPPLFPPNTHAFKPWRWHTIPTTLFETIWNGSVELHLQSHRHGFSVSRCLFILLLSPLLHFTPWLSWQVPFSALTCFCVTRRDCWVVRRCSPAWPWCKPTTSQARRR